MKYTGQCIGRLISFLERYKGLTIAHNVQFGNGKITLHGKPYASYTWKYDDVPVFSFEDGSPPISREREIDTIKDIWGFRPIAPPNDTYEYLGAIKVREVFDIEKTVWESFLSLTEYRFYLSSKDRHRSLNAFGFFFRKENLSF